MRDTSPLSYSVLREKCVGISRIWARGWRPLSSRGLRVFYVRFLRTWQHREAAKVSDHCRVSWSASVKPQLAFLSAGQLNGVLVVLLFFPFLLSQSIVHTKTWFSWIVTPKQLICKNIHPSEKFQKETPYYWQKHTHMAVNTGKVSSGPRPQSCNYISINNMLFP